MKKIIFTLLCAMTFSLTTFAQDLNSNGDNILGEYLSIKDGGKSKIKITKEADGTYTAQVYWVERALDANGNKRKDVKNPDKSLRNVDLDKVILIKGLKYDAKDKEWTDTKIYDPGSGKIYSVDIEFKDAKTLKVYGNILGIGKTVYWTRIEE
ncbi:MAG: DUF2147 domain-containing protein [Bacteroidaceae bacterium]|nr:DUF2147 domain-containing protein [Bacteroidaceae bacterium]